jgi:ribosomal protein S18 acetylase RimI-like enzyme
MEMRDVDPVVQVHVSSFRGFFLTFLGPAFLCELYSAILADPSGIACVSEEEGHIVGFVAGTSQPNGFYTRLLRRRWWRFGLAALKPTLRDPRIAPRLLRALTMPSQVRDLEGHATLMSIAVLPERQGRGIGHVLVRQFLAEARHRGLTTVNLTTDRLDNEAANSFYLRLGFELVRHYVTAEGRQMNEYAAALSPGAEEVVRPVTGGIC